LLLRIRLLEDAERALKMMYGRWILIFKARPGLFPSLTLMENWLGVILGLLHGTGPESQLDRKCHHRYHPSRPSYGRRLGSPAHLVEQQIRHLPGQWTLRHMLQHGLTEKAQPHLLGIFLTTRFSPSRVPAHKCAQKVDDAPKTRHLRSVLA
jgi:hypothetical protein